MMSLVVSVALACSVWFVSEVRWVSWQRGWSSWFNRGTPLLFIAKNSLEHPKVKLSLLSRQQWRSGLQVKKDCKSVEWPQKICLPNTGRRIFLPWHMYCLLSRGLHCQHVCCWRWRSHATSTLQPPHPQKCWAGRGWGLAEQSQETAERLPREQWEVNMRLAPFCTLVNGGITTDLLTIVVF